MKTDTKWIQKLERAAGYIEYSIMIRKNKRCEWIFLGNVPTMKIAHALVKVGREIYFGEEK